jgi:hypothetical protein
MDSNQEKHIAKQIDCLSRGWATMADAWTAFENDCMSDDQATFIAGPLKHLRDIAQKQSDDKKKGHTKWLDKAIIVNGSLKLVDGGKFKLNGENFDAELFMAMLNTPHKFYKEFLVQAYERFGIDVSTSKTTYEVKMMGSRVIQVLHREKHTRMKTPNV